MTINQLLTDVVVRRLEALREALRPPPGMYVEILGVARAGDVVPLTEAQREAIRAFYGYPTRGPADFVFPFRTASGGCVIPAEALGSLWPAGTQRVAAVSYVGTEETAMEAIRLAGEQSNEGRADQYRPVEGAVSSCTACPALVAPEDLWVGKRSGIALCDPCMDKWEKAGRAKRTGEF